MPITLNGTTGITDVDGGTVLSTTDLATQAEAEAGTNNTKLMTPLRTKQGIVALASGPNYQSAEQTIALAGALTLTHGLGRLPNSVDVWLVCKTADLGWSVGDWYGPVGAETFGDGANNGVAIAMNTTEIKITTGAQSVTLLNRSTGTRAVSTLTSWRYVVRAW